MPLRSAKYCCALRRWRHRTARLGAVFFDEVSEPAGASPVARQQNRRMKRITTLRHTGLELNDPLSRNLLDFLDGTRDFTALVEAMAAVVQAGEATLQAKGEQ